MAAGLGIRNDATSEEEMKNLQDMVTIKGRSQSLGSESGESPSVGSESGRLWLSSSPASDDGDVYPFPLVQSGFLTSWKRYSVDSQCETWHLPEHRPAVQTMTDWCGRHVDQIYTKTEDQKTQRVVPIIGLPGAGISTLLYEFIARYHHQYRYVIWLNCAKGLNELIRSFAYLISQTGSVAVEAKEGLSSFDSIDTHIDVIKDWLRNQKESNNECLLIFQWTDIDLKANENFNVIKALIAGQHSVLVVLSHLYKPWERDYGIVRVDPLSVPEACDFLQQRYARFFDDPSDVKSLVNSLPSRIPGMLVGVGHYLQIKSLELRLSLSEVVKSLTEQLEAHSNAGAQKVVGAFQEGFDSQVFCFYQNLVNSIFKQFDSQPLPLLLFKIASSCQINTDIPVELLRRVFISHSNEPPESFDAAMKVLIERELFESIGTNPAAPVLVKIPYFIKYYTWHEKVRVDDEYKTIVNLWENFVQKVCYQDNLVFMACTSEMGAWIPHISAFLELVEQSYQVRYEYESLKLTANVTLPAGLLIQLRLFNQVLGDLHRTVTRNVDAAESYFSNARVASSALNDQTSAHHALLLRSQGEIYFNSGEHYIDASHYFKLALRCKELVPGEARIICAISYAEVLSFEDNAEILNKAEKYFAQAEQDLEHIMPDRHSLYLGAIALGRANIAESRAILSNNTKNNFFAKAVKQYQRAILHYACRKNEDKRSWARAVLAFAASETQANADGSALGVGDIKEAGHFFQSLKSLSFDYIQMIALVNYGEALVNRGKNSKKLEDLDAGIAVLESVRVQLYRKHDDRTLILSERRGHGICQLALGKAYFKKAHLLRELMGQQVDGVCINWALDALKASEIILTQPKFHAQDYAKQAQRWLSDAQALERERGAQFLPERNLAYVPLASTQTLFNTWWNEVDRKIWVVMQGVNGAGKTQAMLDWAHRWLPHSYKIWLAAATKQQLAQSVRAFLKSRNPQSAIEYVTEDTLKISFQQWQNEHPVGLLCIDGVRDFPMIEAWVSPNPIAQWTVLLTTDRDDLLVEIDQPERFEILPFNGLPKVEARRVLVAYTGASVSEEDVNSLDEIIAAQALPLEMMLIGKALNYPARPIPIRTLCEQMQNRRVVGTEGYSAQERSIIRAVESSFYLFADAEAAEFLVCCSQLNTEQLSSRFMLALCAGDLEQYARVTEKLCSLGLIQKILSGGATHERAVHRNGEGHFYKVHRAVRRALINISQRQKERSTVLRKVANALKQELHHCLWCRDQCDYRRELAQHCDALNQHIAGDLRTEPLFLGIFAAWLNVRLVDEAQSADFGLLGEFEVFLNAPALAIETPFIAFVTAQLYRAQAQVCEQFDVVRWQKMNRFLSITQNELKRLASQHVERKGEVDDNDFRFLEAAWYHTNGSIRLELSSLNRKVRNRIGHSGEVNTLLDEAEDSLEKSLLIKDSLFPSSNDAHNLELIVTLDMLGELHLRKASRAFHGNRLRDARRELTEAEGYLSRAAKSWEGAHASEPHLEQLQVAKHFAEFYHCQYLLHKEDLSLGGSSFLRRCEESLDNARRIALLLYNDKHHPELQAIQAQVKAYAVAVSSLAEAVRTPSLVSSVSDGESTPTLVQQKTPERPTHIARELTFDSPAILAPALSSELKQEEWPRVVPTQKTPFWDAESMASPQSVASLGYRPPGQGAVEDDSKDASQDMVFSAANGGVTVNLMPFRKMARMKAGTANMTASATTNGMTLNIDSDSNPAHVENIVGVLVKGLKPARPAGAAVTPG